MKQLGHAAGSAGFVRDFTLLPKTNRLQSMTVGGSSYAYQYDVNGNMVREHTTRHFEWDHSDQMRVFRNQVTGGEPSVHVQYLYDADGQRVKKLVRKQGGGIVEVTVYIDELFEHHRQVKGGVTKENSTLHVMDDERRIAMVRVGNALDASDTSPAVQYQLGDHLGSSNVVVNADGTWINREEFTPYGETSFGRYAGKRYRFTGKERDEESGFNYYGARYYAGWFGRWLSCDPLLSWLHQELLRNKAIGSAEFSTTKYPFIYNTLSKNVDSISSGVNEPTSHLEKLFSQSGYLFVNANPANWIDPSGLSPSNPRSVRPQPTRRKPPSMRRTRPKAKGRPPFGDRVTPRKLPDIAPRPPGKGLPIRAHPRFKKWFGPKWGLRITKVIWIILRIPRLSIPIVIDPSRYPKRITTPPSRWPRHEPGELG